MAAYKNCFLNPASERMKCTALAGGACSRHGQKWQLGPERLSGKGNEIEDIKAFLDKRNYPYDTQVTHARACKLQARCQRGLLPYETQGKKELRKFIRSRGLESTITGNVKKMKHKQLVKALERADDVATFDKFADLPPELRNNIYRMRFEGSPALNSRAAFPPPFCEITKQYRNDSLPLFWKQSTCVVEINISNGRGVRANRSYVSIGPSVAKQLRIPDKDFGSIRNLRVIVRSQFSTPAAAAGPAGRIEWEIDLDDNEPWKKSPQNWLNSDSKQWWSSAIDISAMPRSWVNQQADQFRALVKDMSKRPTNTRLQKTDFEAMRRAIMRDIGIRD